MLTQNIYSREGKLSGRTQILFKIDNITIAMEVQRNSKDSMKSTWRQADRTTWTHHHWMLEWLGLQPNNLGQEVPVHDKTDKIPFVPNWQQQRWVILHACIPLIMHQIYVSYTGHNLHPVAAFVFYTFVLKAIAIKQINMLRGLGHRYGFLDGDKHERDQVS